MAGPAIAIGGWWTSTWVRSGRQDGLGEAGPAGGLDGDQHGPDVVIGGVVHRDEAVDQAVVECRPGGRVVPEGDE
jgi:hypothetical protein